MQSFYWQWKLKKVSDSSYITKVKSIKIGNGIYFRKMMRKKIRVSLAS